LKTQKKVTENDSYIPAEDTFFFAENLKNTKGKNALDIGAGTGYLTKILSTKFHFVVATDINFNSLKSQSEMKNCVCCYGADSLKCDFDLIICNMPYLPSDTIIDKTIDGGREGIQVPFEIIQSALKRIKKNGRFLFLTSSLANYHKILEKTKKLGYDVCIVARKKLFFEELILVQAQNRQN